MFGRCVAWETIGSDIYLADEEENNLFSWSLEKMDPGSPEGGRKHHDTDTGNISEPPLASFKTFD